MTILALLRMQASITVDIVLVSSIFVVCFYISRWSAGGVIMEKLEPSSVRYLSLRLRMLMVYNTIGILLGFQLCTYSEASHHGCHRSERSLVR